MRKQHSNLNCQKLYLFASTNLGDKELPTPRIYRRVRTQHLLRLIKAPGKRGSLQVFCFEVHDFTVVDLFIVTNVSSTIGSLSWLVIRSVYSGGVEGSICNIIVS